jgi:hypothetical protein
MKLDVRAFGLAVSVVTALGFILCALLIAVMPRQAWAWFGALFHVDFAPVAREPSRGEIVGGLAAWVLGSFVVASGAAWLYNRIARK